MENIDPDKAKRFRRRTLWWGGSIAAIAIAGIIVAVTVILTPEDPKPNADPAPSTTISASPTVSPSPSAEIATDDPGVVIPATCEYIYTPAMFASLKALELPFNDPSLADSSGTVIPALAERLLAAPGLHCSWGLPSELGINTNVSTVDDVAATEIEAILRGEGLACAREFDGLLCTITQGGPETEGWVEGDPQAGESHFLRDGIWIATHWGTVEMSGYTEDIIATLWR